MIRDQTRASERSSIAFPPTAALSLDQVRVDIAQARTMARAGAKAVPERSRVDHAANFARVAFEAFASTKSRAPTDSFAALPRQLDADGQLLAETIGWRAAALSTVEAAHVLTSLYATLLPGDRRSALGAFYTPPVLSTRLLDMATNAGVDWRTARVLDPAAGGGAFLVQAAKRMLVALGGCEPAFALSQIGSRLLGLEVDPHAAGLAQAALDVVLADLAAKCDRSVPILVRVCDTLEETPTPTFDLVVGNPPFGRVALTPQQRRRYGRSLYGHANLYGVFTDIALRWMRPEGMIAYLTPTSFLAGQYYGALRALLAGEAPPVAIDFVHARSGVFEDVLQETLLAVYKRSTAPKRAEVRYLNVINEREAELTRNGTIGLPASPSAPWLAPREPEHSPLIRRVEAMSTRLKDLGYSVSTGPLVWNRFKSQLRHSCDEARVYPLIWAEAVTADGRFVFRAEKRNHAPYFKLGLGDAWLLVQEPCVLVQRTTAKEQRRRLIAAELPASFVREAKGVIVENHLNMVGARGVPKISAGVVAALLNSEIVDQVFRCMSGSVAVSAFELEALPLPDVAALKPLELLIAYEASQSKVEAEIRALYMGGNRE